MCQIKSVHPALIAPRNCYLQATVEKPEAFQLHHRRRSRDRPLHDVWSASTPHLKNATQPAEDVNY
ncbi:hypothetical protein DPMN_056187 [Dreissena polymorpha]|uniref:Uncharacterized protein n=1 Tax=Dreissena polymorpha TaxID=45954 RepID=A0A9D4CTZ3_DREPO|nr:hypothetical protein DPMN_056187 [Dreissena polymorpha]